MVTVIVLNVHFRTSSTHTMSPWVRQMFLTVLPRILGMRRPRSFPEVDNTISDHDNVELQKDNESKTKSGKSRNVTDSWFDPLSLKYRSESGGRSNPAHNIVESKTSQKKSKSLSSHEARSKDSYLRWKIPRPKIQEISGFPDSGIRKSISSQIVVYSQSPRTKWLPASVSSTRKFPTNRNTTEDLAQLDLSRKMREFRNEVEYLGGHMQKQDQDMTVWRNFLKSF